MSCSLAHSTYLAPHISFGPATQVIVVVFVAVVISFFREVIYSYFDKGCRKTVHVTFPKGNMGYDQYTVPVAFESTFVAFR